MYRVLLAFHHPPTTLAQAVDRIVRSEPGLLYLWLPPLVTDIMGLDKWDHVVSSAPVLNTDDQSN